MLTFVPVTTTNFQHAHVTISTVHSIAGGGSSERFLKNTHIDNYKFKINNF